MDILDTMTPAQLRAKVETLTTAISRAHYCLTDGRRVGDAIKVLKMAAPIECNGIDPGDGGLGDGFASQ